jgi:hypothetical protein
VEERPRATPASTSHARDRPSDSKVGGCRGGGRMPGRERQRTDAGAGAPDAVVAAALRLGGVASGRRKLASRTGKPSRPNESWISSARKTQGSGLRSSPWWAAKGRTNLARGRMTRGRLAQRKGGDPAGNLGCQSRPKECWGLKKHE